MDPRRFLHCIADNYDALETIVRQSPNLPFSKNELRLILQDINGEDSIESILSKIKRMQSLDVIIKEARSDNFILNVHTQGMIEYLSKESVLETPHEIKGYIRALDSYRNDLDKAIKIGNGDLITQSCIKIDYQLRKIQKHLLSNQDAIVGIVANAKMANNRQSLQQRYHIVLKALEEYVKPMIEMVSPNRRFARTLKRLENQIVRLVPAKTEELAVYDTSPLESINNRLLELMHRSDASLKEANRILVPLCNDLRRNTELSRAAATILEACRKKGARRALVQLKLPSIGRRTKRTFSISNAEIYQLAAKFRLVKAESHEMVQREEPEDAVTPQVIQYGALRIDVEKTLPIDDLFAWLLKRYSDYPLEAILDSYFWIRAQTDTGEYKDLKVYNIHRFKIKKFAYRVSKLKTRVKS